MENHDTFKTIQNRIGLKVLSYLPALFFSIMALHPAWSIDETFPGNNINPVYWSDQDLNRSIEDGKFKASFKQNNRTTSARLFLQDPTSVDSYSAEYSVLSASANGVFPRVYLTGIFFSDGVAPVNPGSTSNL